jgi:hypothetical protein
MTAKILPTALLAALVLAMLGSYGGTYATRPVGQESCYQSKAGKGWICLWESPLGEKCWRSDQGSACTKQSAGFIQSGRGLATKD